MANKQGARQNSRFLAFCTAPDFCKTPVGSSTPPIPYQVMADLGQSDKTVPNVRFSGNPCKVLDQSTVPRCIGDEPGVAGGVISGTVAGEAKPTGASTNVRAGGRWVVREFDPCTLNSGNCPGIYVTVPAPGSIGTGGKPTPQEPAARPDTPGEVQAAQERKGIWGKLSGPVHFALGAAGFIPGLGAVPDLLDAGVYALEGDALSAGLSLGAAVPFAGDALKAGTLASKAGKRVLQAAGEKSLKQAGETALKATDEVAAAMRQTEKQLLEDGGQGALKNAETAVTNRTSQAGNTGSAAGKKAPTDGNVHVQGNPRPPKPRKPDVKEWQKKGGKVERNRDGSVTYTDKDGVSVTYNKDGYPDFKPYSKGEVPIDMKGNGGDFSKADQAYRQQIGDPNWQRPKDYTWHHHQDGRTMQLVPSKINAEFSHTGGASMARGRR